MRLLFILTLLTTPPLFTLSKVINTCPFNSNIHVEYYKNNKPRKQFYPYLQKKNQYQCSIINNADESIDFQSKHDIPLIESFECFDSPGYIPLGLVIDYKFYKHYRKHLINTIEELFSHVNFVYSQQFNTIFSITNLIISKKGNNKWDPCTNTIHEKLHNFHHMIKDHSFKGYWHLLTHCDEYNPSGVALINGLHSLTNKAKWITIAHELGHNFGKHHITSYGIMTPHGPKDIKGIVKFNQDSKDKLCESIAKARHINICSTCGNGIIEFGEECECPNIPDQKCNCCHNCKLTGVCDPYHNQCCNQECNYKSVTNKCHTLNHKGERVEGYCALGYCQLQQVCETVNVLGKYCGLHPDNRCKTRCEYNNECHDLNGFTTSQGPINYVVKGASCADNKICDQGECT